MDGGDWNETIGTLKAFLLCDANDQGYNHH